MSQRYSTPGSRRTARLEFLDFLRTFLAGVVLQHILDTKFVRCTAFMTADKNVNRLESRKLRTTLGCDAGPHVLRHPGVP